MQDEEFEWDDDKAARNLIRHGVSFEVARRAFDDVFGVARDDRREDYGEDRATLIAMVEGRLVFVAVTMRQDRVRIIMARLAEPFEKQLYHDENTQD